MAEEEGTVFTLNVGTDSRVVESGIRVTKEDIDKRPDLVRERLKTKLSEHVTKAVDQLFGPPKEDAVAIEEPKKEEPKEETKEEPVKEEEKKEEVKEEEKPAEEKKEEEPPAEEKKEDPPKDEKKEEVKEEPKKDAA